MTEKEQELPATATHITDHLANERTFLTWVRTSLGIMAFGFVVEKFTFFLKQVSALLLESGVSDKIASSTRLEGYSSGFGIFLVGMGALLSILASIRFKHVEEQIKTNSYQPSLLLDGMLSLIVVFIGSFLVLYLLNFI